MDLTHMDEVTHAQIQVVTTRALTPPRNLGFRPHQEAIRIVASAVQLSTGGSIMSGIKPTKVTFLNHNELTGKYPLEDSHYSSLDDESYYTHGNPEQAVIVG